ncbi:MAG: hypothetical protein ACE37F_21005 [Nannocystaceae bacterium]|nr:hypothetical protein [bacterium]
MRHVGETWAPGEGSSLAATLELRSEGTETASGLATRGSAWAARQSAVVHEIGHLITFEDDGVSAAVLSEGIAELIDGDGVLQAYRPPPDLADFMHLQRPEFSAQEYAPAAQLLSFLSRRYGLAAVRDAYRRVGPESFPDEIDDAFVMAFGDGVFDAFEAFQAEPQCPILLWQCSDDVVPTVELPFALELDPRTCGDADIPGFTAKGSDDWFPEYLGVLRLSEPRIIGYRVDNAIITRQQCQDTCTPMESVPPWTWQFVQEQLGQKEFTSHTRAGDHHVKIRPENPGRPFMVEVVDLGPA